MVPTKWLASCLIICFLVVSSGTITVGLVTPRELHTESHVTKYDEDVMRSAYESNGAYEIYYPRTSCPSFVVSKGAATFSFTADELFDEVLVYIATAYEPVVDAFWLPVDNVYEENKRWFVEVKVPADVPEELYNLTFLFNQNGSFFAETEPRAVQVVEEFTDTFTFIHITDFHVGDPRGFAENFRETLRYRSILRCIKEVNLLHPDFVVISGDLVYGQIYPFEYQREYELFYQMLQLFDVPTFLAPGNHDGYNRLLEDGFEYWQDYFGPLYYSFDYGAYHFLSINSFDMTKLLRLTFCSIPLNWGGSISDEQLSWIEQDLDAAESPLSFMFLHHSPLWDTQGDSLLRRHYENREQLLSLIDKHDVDMVLAGHIHNDTVNIVNDTVFITTTTPQSEIREKDGYWGYRQIQITDGVITSYNYKEPDFSIPSYHLDYTIISNPLFTSAKITNDLEMNVSTLLKFVLPKREYTVENACVAMQRSNAELVELYVTAELSPQSERRVTITPTHRQIH